MEIRLKARRSRARNGLCLIPLVLAMLPTLAIAADPPIVTVDRLISHVSNVPAIAGRKIDLFVREKAPPQIVNGQVVGSALAGKVVLFVHGGYSPSTLAFDVGYRDYSWMAFLARAGFDVFAMDMTGYGKSGRPLMDDPCNLDSKQQTLLFPRTLSQPCTNKYPFELVNTDTETSDISAVVDYIRKLRGVEKLSLIGWSGGGIRTGTFTSRYPERVDKLIIQASSNYDRKNPDTPPTSLPVPGAPMTIQVREVAEQQRWLSAAKCQGQVEPGMPDVIWKLNLDADPLGATWGPGGLRAPTRTYWGWNATAAKRVHVPTLIMVGDQDQLMASNLELYADLGAATKVFLTISCATHFAVWEKQSRMLKRASLEWLQRTSLAGARGGKFVAEPDGRIVRAK